MQIAEMRSSLVAAFNCKNGELPSMPDWVTRRIYEKRHGLSLTPLPREVEVRTVRTFVAATRSNAIARPAVVDEVSTEEQDRLKRRLAFLKSL